MAANWHQTQIEKGVYGELSKVAEEIAEIADTYASDQPVMTLIELSDILGAIDGFLVNRTGYGIEENPRVVPWSETGSLDAQLASLQQSFHDAQEADRKGDWVATFAALHRIVSQVCTWASLYGVDFGGLMRFARLRSAIIADELHTD